MNLSITKLFQRDDGLDEAVSHLKRTVKKENRQVFPNDENPMDEEMERGVRKVIIAGIVFVVLAAITFVIAVIKIFIPHI